MKEPLLSIGMIVKNESRCLERCLKSLEPLRRSIPCQLVIADTGSDDGSREIAAQYADVVFDFEWNGDFAAARNAVLERCTGQWYLSLDADEWLEDAAPLIQFLRDDRDKKVNNAMCIVRNYTDETLRDYGDNFVNRIARRRHGTLRFHYPIHEQMFYTDGHRLIAATLPKFILHHDGYVNLTPEYLKGKMQRNIVVLREELEKDPQDLRLLVHAIQSAYDPEERQDYIVRALQLTPTQMGNPYSPIVYQNSILIFLKRGENRKVVELYTRWREAYPSSPLLEVDGEAAAAAAEYALKQDEEVLEHIRRWRSGIDRVEQGKDLNARERFFTQYYTTTQRWHGKLALFEIHSLLRLERYPEADRAIRQIDLHPVRNEDRLILLGLVLQNEEYLSAAVAFLQKCWELCLPVGEERKEEEKKRLEWKNSFLSQVNQWVRKDTQKVIALLRHLKDCSLGISAQIAFTDDPDQIEMLWEQVDQWDDVLPQAYFHAMELSLPLPDRFYRQPSGHLRKIVADIAENIPQFVCRMADIKMAAGDTLIKLQFQYDLTAAAIQMMGVLRDGKDDERCRLLCDRLVNLAQALLPRIYHPNLVYAAENWNVLPGMHQFGLWLCRGMRYKQSGNPAEYLKALRQGLLAAPLMKDMVDYLLERAEQEERLVRVKQTAPPELLELAEKVRAILAQYSPDDPAIAALKQSEAYQKVAYLIDGLEASAFGGLSQ